jgi:hypothetical protein
LSVSSDNVSDIPSVYTDVKIFDSVIDEHLECVDALSIVVPNDSVERTAPLPAM